MNTLELTEQAEFNPREAEEKQRKEALRQKRNQARRDRNAAFRDCGLVRVRGDLGGTYWE